MSDFIRKSYGKATASSGMRNLTLPPLYEIREPESADYLSLGGLL